MTDEMFIWKPDVALGPVEFGRPMENYRTSIDLRACDDPFEPGKFDCYAYGDDENPSYYADGAGNVENIVCYDHLIFAGKELIGRSINEVIQILGQEPEEYGEPLEGLDGDVEVPLEFDGLGLQLWIVDGVSQSAVLSAAFVEDDDE